MEKNMKGMSFTETTSTLETGEQKRATRDGQTGWPCSRADALMQRHGDDQPILFPPSRLFRAECSPAGSEWAYR